MTAVQVFARPFRAMFARECLHVVRAPTRVISAIGTPALFLVFAGSGFAESFAMPPGESVAQTISYAAFLLPGMVTMVILFSTIFASISLIQDRQSGFLQSALVSPAAPMAIVGAKIIAGATLATVQGVLLLTAAPMLGLTPSTLDWLAAVLAAFLASVSVVSLGMLFAWKIDSTAGFHGVMNLVLMPMWLLSGALFPPSGASPWLAWLVRLNPLHWFNDAIGASLGIGAQEPGKWLGMILVTTVLFVSAAMLLARPPRVS